MQTKKEEVLDDCYISEYQFENTESFVEWAKHIEGLMRAKEATHSDVWVAFMSTLESYEDSYPGPVSVEIRGSRELNKQELKMEAESQEIWDYSKKIGCSYHEAVILLRYKNKS